MAPLFVLSETSAGYVLFKATDKKLLKRSDIADSFKTAEDTCNLYGPKAVNFKAKIRTLTKDSSLKLKRFQKFDNAASALEEASALGEGRVTGLLSSLLDTIKDEKKAALAVADAKLASAIAKIPGLAIKPISDKSTDEIQRAIREHLSSLIPELTPDDLKATNLGLSHSLSRHKLKFSADKVDTMIVNAISLLDDLDKELNTYAMRVREWYGWHFPEMAKIVNDNLAYARLVLAVGMRTNTSQTDLSDILPDDVEEKVKAAAEVSMGVEITQDDLDNISLLAEQVVSFTEYRTQLQSYLANRMQAIAPNLTALVGDLVGARLISHAGSLTELMKKPASTIQILGAEKALFRALKTKHDTPKYGLIYHASLVGQATGKNKGKIARVLAAKAALGVRIDGAAANAEVDEGAMEPTEEERSALGSSARRYVESRLRKLEGKPAKGFGAMIGPAGQMVPAGGARQPGKFEIKEARKYNVAADGLTGDEPVRTEASASKGKGKKPLIEEVEMNGQAVAGAEDEGEEMDVDEDEDEDEEIDEGPAAKSESTATLNGAADVKAQAKAEKAARRAAKEEKRRLKEEKRARKEAKKAAKEDNGVEAKQTEREGSAGVKRRHEGGVEKAEKKKKKKRKTDA